MKHRKWIALLLALCLALPLGALAAEADTELEGLVTELVDGGFVMEDRELGEVLVNMDDTTVRDGILAEGEIEVGQYVIVAYDGRLTRSIPPQAHADRVGCYVLNGTVSEFLENGVLLTGDELFGDVIVRLNGSVPHIYRDMPITVYYDGVMALSLPGQVTARYVIVPELTGVVSEKDADGFTLTEVSEPKDVGHYYASYDNTETGAFFTVMIVPIQGRQDVFLDDEHSQYYSITFDGHDAIWGDMFEGQMNDLLWEHNKLACSIEGNISLHELIKIAQGIVLE